MTFWGAAGLQFLHVNLRICSLVLVGWLVGPEARVGHRKVEVTKRPWSWIANPQQHLNQQRFHLQEYFSCVRLKLGLDWIFPSDFWWSCVFLVSAADCIFKGREMAILLNQWQDIGLDSSWVYWVRQELFALLWSTTHSVIHCTALLWSTILIHYA